MFSFRFADLIIGITFLWVTFPFLLSASPDKESGPGSKYTVSGYLKDHSSGEVLIGATIWIPELGTGVVTNPYGFYSASVVPGNYTFRYSYVGYESQEKPLHIDRNLSLNVYLEPVPEELDEVVVTGRRSDQQVSAPEMSLVKINTGTIGKVPAFLGEVDLIKVIQLLPGVNATSEGTSGFSVRGGNTDQNLIILDEATIYNASHLMGFFSVFNNDAIKEVTLYKGDIPAAYSGRLSSLVDIRMRDGNARKVQATGSIGTVSSKLTLEGPLKKDRSTFLISGRRTYADLFLPLSKNEDIRDNQLFFYDLNFKLTHQFNQNNRIYLSGYSGRDIFRNQFAHMGFGNQTASIRWNSLLSRKLFFNLSLISSDFTYELETPEEEKNSFRWASLLRDYSARADFTWYLAMSHTLRWGTSLIHHRFSPGNITGTGGQSRFSSYSLPLKYALEQGFYISDEFKASEKVTLKAGLRLSQFRNTGPGVFYEYDEQYAPSDSVRYPRGDVVNTYSLLEPRMGLTFLASERASVKGSYSRTVQFLMLAQNSTAGTPLDIWFPASPNVKPQVCDQFALGYFRNFYRPELEFSTEAYYKRFSHVTDFRDHAQLFLNQYLEGELRFGEGVTYGIETMVRKNYGRLTGWLSYTWSRSFRTIPEINDGRRYNAPFDKPHALNLVASYDPGRRLFASLTWVYSTGLPVTFPTGRAFVGNTLVPVYSGRNEYRMPDYHRLDLSLTFRGKIRPERKWHGEWNLSVYNAYNRHNTWSINFVEDDNDPNLIRAEKTYLFAVIPAITYNFKF